MRTERWREEAARAEEHGEGAKKEISKGDGGGRVDIAEPELIARTACSQDGRRESVGQACRKERGRRLQGESRWKGKVQAGSSSKKHLGRDSRDGNWILGFFSAYQDTVVDK
jgi:hypothetical protein